MTDDQLVGDIIPSKEVQSIDSISTRAHEYFVRRFL